MQESFAALGLSPRALNAVEDFGYVEPTPVQAQAIPLVLQGRDIIAAAQTGTGKTAAFVLPCLDLLWKPRKSPEPRMLVITPTRELATQISEVANGMAKKYRLRTTSVVGGLSYDPQIKELKRGCDVLIATPGRLVDLIGQDAVSLSCVEKLVLDEADRMLDMGFLPQVRKIVEHIPAKRQTMLFSATIDKEISKVAKEFLDNPATVEIARKGETAENVEQYVAHIEHAAKADLLLAVLKEHPADKVIVFCRTRHRADTCKRKLERAGYKAEAVHSDRTQNQRRNSLARFADGQTKILVATDVLARGIDISNIDYVVNFDVPTQPEDYVHRIGRTGRADAQGWAVTFVSPENSEEIQAIEKLIKRSIPELELKDFDKEAAQKAAAERAMRSSAQRSKDPEVAKVEAELRKQQRKKDKEREELAQAQAEAPKGKPHSKAHKQGKPSRNAQPKDTANKPSKPSGNTHSKDTARSKQDSRKAGKQKLSGRGNNGTGDAPKHGVSLQQSTKPKQKAQAKLKQGLKPKAHRTGTTTRNQGTSKDGARRTHR